MDPHSITHYTLRELNSKLRIEYKTPKNGRSRKVYIDREKNIVFKLPIGHQGFNEQEYKNYKLFTENTPNSTHNLIVPVASCTLFYTSDNVAIIVMELVTPIKNIIPRELPEWATKGNVDSYQVGYTQDNRLVAFDHTSGKE